MAESENIRPKRTYEENMALARARGAKARADAKVEEKAIEATKQSMLPFWPESVRAVPNSFLRSALFGVSNKRKTYKQRTVIAGIDGHEIRFLGTAFNQTDLDVWEMLLHLARLQPLGIQVEFTAHAFLKALGRGTGKSQHEQLKEEFMRLIAGAVEITWKNEGKAFAGALVYGYFRDDETGGYVVKFNPDMLTLYETGNTYIDFGQRLALGRNNLAKWLHGHYATHAKPYPYKVETLRDLSGSTTGRLVDFRVKLRVALDALKAVGAIVDWSIDEDDLVHVVNVPSGTQQRHLKGVKKLPKKPKT